MSINIKDYLQQHSELIRLYCQIRKLPPAECTYLAHGANNILYRVISGRRNCICKIGINPSFRRLKTEYLIIRGYHFFRGLTDYFTDPVSGTELLIMPYINGKHFSALDKTQIGKLGQAIASYHHPARCIPGIEIEDAARFCDTRILPVTATDDNARYCRRFRRLLDEAAGHLTGKHSATESVECAVLVHGDLIPNNIFFTAGGAVRFIDWEGARYDNPEADLATSIKGFNFTESETEWLLSAYGRPINRRMLAIRLVLHYLQVAAWRMAVQLNIETDHELYDNATDELELELDFIEAGINSCCERE